MRTYVAVCCAADRHTRRPAAQAGRRHVEEWGRAAAARRDALAEHCAAALAPAAARCGLAGAGAGAGQGWLRAAAASMRGREAAPA